MRQTKRILYGAIAALFWLAVWEVTARWVNLPFVLPTVGETARALLSLLITADFWQTIAASLLRILLGLLAGTLLGMLLALLSCLGELPRAIIVPVQKIVQCTPVASFILILWVLVGRDTVPQAVALLMVSPVIWQALSDGYRRLDPQLDEVLQVFRASPLRRFRLLVIPGLKGCFLTAFATAAGLAWKAGVAAEIIAYTNHSIGRQIADARNLFDGAAMVAWTLCVIVLSLVIGRLIDLAGRGLRKEACKDA